MQKHDLLVALTNYNVVGRVSWIFYFSTWSSRFNLDGFI